MGLGGGGRDALEGKGPQKRLDRRLDAAAKAVGGGCCRLQMPLKLARAVREMVSWHRLDNPEVWGGGGTSAPSNVSLGQGGGTQPTAQIFGRPQFPT